MFKKLLLPALTFASSFCFAQSNETPLPDWIVPAHGQFEYGFIKNKVHVRIRPEYRAFCTSSNITIPHFDHIFNQLQVSSIKRSFPSAELPRTTFNEFGQRLEDLTLIYEIDYLSDVPMEKALRMFTAHEAVDYAEPNFLSELLYVPNDADSTVQYALADIDAYEAWDITHGDTNVVICISDLGTSFIHPDYVNQMWYNTGDTALNGMDDDNDGYIDNYVGWDFGGSYFGSPGDNYPEWGGGANHGVLVAGPATAEADNFYCMAGACYECSQLPTKIGVDGLQVPFWGYQAAVYGADHGAHIVNMSWGGGRTRFGEDALNYCSHNKHVMLVCANGNNHSNTVIYPAGFSSVMSVAGSSSGKTLWVGGGPGGFGTTYNYLTEITAPADLVYVPQDDALCGGAFSGTSVAAPWACGVAGLVKSAMPALNMHQVQERVRRGADPAFYTGLSSTYTERLGRGLLNANNALLHNDPSVRIVDYMFDDGTDQTLKPGDTIDLRVRFINWLAPVNAVNVTLTSISSTKLQVLHGTQTLGDMATLDTVSSWLCPFRIRLTTSAVAGERLYLKFSYSGAGYTDYEYIELIVSPSYVHVDENNMETSLSSTGVWGYMNWPTSTQGKGVMQEGYGMYIEEGGFMVGDGPTRVSNNVRNPGGTKDAHFTSVTPVYRTMPGVHADFEAYAHYNDNAAGASKLGVTVNETAFQWKDSLANDFIIFEYKIINDNVTPLTGVYAGHYIDWWMWNDYANHIRYDSANKMTYAWDHWAVHPRWLGLSLISEQDGHPFGEIDSSNVYFNFTTADKFKALTADPDTVNVDEHYSIGMMSGGPFDIAAGDTQTVAFALVSADFDTSVGLAACAARAKLRYDCVVRGMMTRADLGPDVWQCNSTAAIVLDPGAGYSSYLWNTGATSPTLSVTESGTYSVMVTDASGCVDFDYIDVAIDDLSGGFTSSPALMLVGDTITFTDTSSAPVTEWCWDFGDGSTACPILPVAEHVFTAPGTYTVCMYITTGYCIDTVCTSVTVDTLVSVVAPGFSGSLQVYPVPASESLTLEWTSPWSGEATILLRNMLGTVVSEEKVTKNTVVWRQTLNVAALPSGVYFAEVRTGGGVKVAKAVVSR